MRNGATRPNRLEHLNRDSGYRFAGGDHRDPIMEEVCYLIDKSGMDIGEIIETVLDFTNGQVHMSYQTIYRWLHGPTRKPQNEKVDLVLKALGYERRIMDEKQAARFDNRRLRLTA